MILNRLTVFLYVLLSPSLISCGINTEPELTDEMIKKLFNENKIVVSSFTNFCLNNRSVKWMGIGAEEIELAPDLKIEPKNVALTEVRMNLNLLGAEALMCTRDWSVSTAPLVSITIPLYGIGLSISGSSKGLRYLTNENAYVIENIKKGRLKSLGEDGWYIYVSGK